MSCLNAFHYKSWGTFFVLKKPYNFLSGVTHYRNYRALKEQLLMTYSVTSVSVSPDSLCIAGHRTFKCQEERILI